MERQFPKNVRQVGNVCDTPKIYVEDYVDTYLNQLKDKASEHATGAFLIGEMFTIEGQECVCIFGAVNMQEPDIEEANIQIDEEVFTAADIERKEYFQNGEIVGWILIKSGGALTLNENLTEQHEKMFPQKNSIFILKDAVENEEVFFAYKFHELMQVGGHYVYYEKNPSMQNYMISTRRQIGVTPSEVVEDRAAKDFRTTVREKLEEQDQKSNSRFVYVTSALLVVVVLAIGISTMNNYDKMNSVQTTLETLSKSVQSSAGEQEVQVQVTEENADGAAKEAAAASTSTAPAPAESTAAQEEASQKEYYTVQKGDTLDKISQKLYGTTSQADAICKMNGLTDGNLIFIGQKLLLP